MNTADPLRKVAAGEPRHITASAWNSFVETARRVLHPDDGGHVEDIKSGPLPHLIVTVRNDSGADRDRGHVLMLNAAILDAATIPYDAQRGPFSTFAPVASAPPARPFPLVILLEPIPSNKFGRAAAYGLAVCDVNVTDANHTHATWVAADAAKLTSSSSGPAHIISRPFGTGVKRSVVFLTDHYGYAGETPTGVYWDGLLSTEGQTIKGAKKFRDPLTVSADDVGYVLTSGTSGTAGTSWAAGQGGGGLAARNAWNSVSGYVVSSLEFFDGESTTVPQVGVENRPFVTDAIQVAGDLIVSGDRFFAHSLGPGGDRRYKIVRSLRVAGIPPSPVILNGLDFDDPGNSPLKFRGGILVGTVLDPLFGGFPPPPPPRP